MSFDPPDTGLRGAIVKSFANPRGGRRYRHLPLAIVFVVLVTLVVASLLLGKRSDSLRARFTEVVSPAGTALLRVQVSLAGELAAIRGYQITGERLYLTRLRLARASEAKAADRLAALAPRLGPEVERAVEVLEERRNTWSEGPEELLAGRVTRAQLTSSLTTGQQRFEAALIAADDVSAAINRAEDSLVHGIGAAAWFERILVILLSLGALPVVLVVGWLSRHLSESEARFRQIAENLREAVWISDPALTSCYYVNPGFERIWRQPVAMMYANARSFLAPVHPEDRAQVEGAIADYARGDFRLLFRIVRSHGEIRWISARASGVRDDEGRIFRIVGTAEDITERRRAEEEREMVLAREREARTETEAALRTRDRVLRIVSHDLKNPLNTIGMTTELLEMPFPPEKRQQQIGIRGGR
jgi:PAS domain S-box-containing protein